MSDGLFADLALIEGKVVTVDKKNTIAEALAIKDNKIVRVGTTKQIKKLIDKATKVIDLKGRTVLPGLTDPHVHMISDAAKALDTSRFDCRDFHHRGIESIDDIVSRLKEYSEKVPKGEWIRAEGSPMQQFRMKDKRCPNRFDLDKATTDHPVLITFGAHVTAVNTKGLELAKINRDTPNPVGGWIEKDENGEPTGVLREKARPLVMNLMYPNGREVNEEYTNKGLPIPEISSDTYLDMKKGVEEAVKRCLHRGCTTVHDVVTSPAQIRAYEEVLAEGKLKMRISLLVRIFESQIKEESVLNLGLVTGFGNDWLSIGGAKISIDGGTTGCNAAMHEPYLHEPDNRGVIRISQERLDNLISRIHKAGLRLVVHASGDRALDMALDAYEKAILEYPRKDHRHRIEHQPRYGNKETILNGIARMKRLGILPVPNMALNIYYNGDTLLEVVGSNRFEKPYPFKTLLKQGFKVTNGTDAPGYIPVDPIREIWSCVTRTTWSGKQVAPEECISVMDAIRIHTINAAYNEFAEDRKGSIEPRKLADLVVLAEDPLTIEPEKIKDIKVDYTIVDGKIVYQRSK